MIPQGYPMWTVVATGRLAYVALVVGWAQMAPPEPGDIHYYQPVTAEYIIAGKTDDAEGFYASQEAAERAAARIREESDCGPVRRQ